MRRSRKPPSKAKQIRELKEQLQKQTEATDRLSIIIGQIGRTSESWKAEAISAKTKIQELQEEAEAIKHDLKTCKAWSNLEVCIQQDFRRVFRVCLDINERQMESARLLLSSHIVGNPRWRKEAEIDAHREIQRASDEVVRVVKRKLVESFTEYFANERKHNEGRIY